MISLGQQHRTETACTCSSFGQTHRRHRHNFIHTGQQHTHTLTLTFAALTTTQHSTNKHTDDQHSCGSQLAGTLARRQGRCQQPMKRYAEDTTHGGKGERQQRQTECSHCATRLVVGQPHQDTTTLSQCSRQTMTSTPRRCSFYLLLQAGTTLMAKNGKPGSLQCKKRERVLRG